ncbi:MAG: hypothetical protein JWN78_1924 [Bacteroidota bacterium]|nr:hypothetical protein [Bacteroidota bacterium]
MYPILVQTQYMILSIDLLSWHFWHVPIVSGFIGWITTWMAVKMLFYPRRPIDIGVYVVQGIFPKNKDKIASKLGAVVQKDLINFTDIKHKLMDAQALANFGEEISIQVEKALRDKIEANVFSRTLIPEPLIQSIHKSIAKEIENALPNVIDSSITKIEQKLDIEAIVTEKVKKFSDQKLEDLLLAVTKKEFTFIEIVGGVFGFLIGILQAVISDLT